MVSKLKVKRLLIIAVSFLISLFCFGVIFARITAADEGTSAKTMADLWENERFSTITTAQDLPSYANHSNSAYVTVPEKGIKVVASGHNATINFKNVVNVSDLTKNDEFIKIFIAPTTLGGPGTARYTQDFGKINVRLTDAEDESNYIDILVQRSIWGAGTYWQVATKDVPLGGWGTFNGFTGILTDNRGANVGGFGPFYGQGANDLNKDVPPICIRYDNADRAVFALDTAGALKATAVRDLDNAEHMGAGFEWGGFTSGRVKISISALDFYSASGTYYITEFMGLDVTQSMISDSTAPIVQTDADVEPGILTGVIGRDYPVFDAVADDLVWGELPIKKEIVEPGSEVPVSLTGDTYLPTKAGDYKLIYSSTDSAQNVAEKTYALTVLPAHPEISIRLEDSLVTSGYVGQTIKIPKATTTGGVHTVNVEIVVEQKEQDFYQKIEDDFFMPESAGTYTVRYIATDYLSGCASLESELVVTRGKAPIVQFPVLSSVFIADRAVALPSMVAWDYINDPSYRQTAIVEVYASNTPVVGETYGTKIENPLAYVPALSSANVTKETLYITYVAYCTGYESDKVVKTYPVKLTKLSQLYDLFDMEDITPTLVDSHITFTTETEGASMSYGMPISARQSEIVFEISKETNNFNVLRLTVTDSQNSAQQVQLDITKTLGNAKSYVYVHGTKYIMYGSFDETAPSETEPNQSFKIKFSEDMRSISDVKGTKICNFNTYLDGSAFKGFESGKIYVEFEFIGVTGESAIDLKTFGLNQPVKGFTSKDEFVDFVDTGKPYIYISDELAQEAEIGRRVYIPAAFAYDVIDSSVSCYVEVLKTVGQETTTVIKSTAAEVGVSFVPTDYGIYTVRFSAKDFSGNNSQRTLYVYVEDTNPPTLIVDGSYKASYTINSKISILNGVAQDLENEVALNIFVISPTGKSTLVQIDDEFTFEKAGRYIIRYCAFDFNYNYTMIDFNIDVE